MYEDLKFRPIDNRDLSTRVRITILDWINQRSDVEGDKPFKLPPEQELAEIIGVSRTALRDALIVMEGEGYLTRRRGIGTLVNPKIAKCRTRIDLQTEIGGMITAQGYEATFKVFSMEKIDEAIPGIEDEKGYLEIKKIFYASGKSCAICVDRLVKSRLDNFTGDVGILQTMNLYEFMKKYLNIQNAYAFSTVKAVVPKQEWCELLQVDPAKPSLSLYSLSYDSDHLAYLSSDVYINTDILEINLLRKAV